MPVLKARPPRLERGSCRFEGSRAWALSPALTVAAPDRTTPLGNLSADVEWDRAGWMRAQFGHSLGAMAASCAAESYDRARR
jgi:hypothetical protein